MKGKPFERAGPRRRLGREEAETIAVQALGWLAADPERLGRFLALTGLAPETVRRAAAEPGFLAAVLDHVSADEVRLTAFAAETGLDPARAAEARERLGGPDPAGGWEG